MTIRAPCRSDASTMSRPSTKRERGTNRSLKTSNHAKHSARGKDVRFTPPKGPDLADLPGVPSPQTPVSHLSLLLTSAAGSWKCTWGFSGYCPNDSSSSSSSGGRRPRGAGSPGRQCRKRVAETGAKTCIFPSDLIRDFGLVGGCSECGGLAAYQCVGDMPGVCCPPAAATRDTLQIVRDGSENTCTRVDAEEDIGVLAEKM